MDLATVVVDILVGLWCVALLVGVAGGSASARKGEESATDCCNASSNASM